MDITAHRFPELAGRRQAHAMVSAVARQRSRGGKHCQQLVPVTNVAGVLRAKACAFKPPKTGCGAAGAVKTNDPAVRWPRNVHEESAAERVQPSTADPVKIDKLAVGWPSNVLGERLDYEAAGCLGSRPPSRSSSHDPTFGERLEYEAVGRLRSRPPAKSANQDSTFGEHLEHKAAGCLGPRSPARWSSSHDLTVGECLKYEAAGCLGSKPPALSARHASNGCKETKMDQVQPSTADSVKTDKPAMQWPGNVT